MNILWVDYLRKVMYIIEGNLHLNFQNRDSRSMVFKELTYIQMVTLDMLE